jgi:hypothetical protein
LLPGSRRLGVATGSDPSIGKRGFASCRPAAADRSGQQVARTTKINRARRSDAKRNRYANIFLALIKSSRTPRPVHRVPHQSRRDWIVVDVLEFCVEGLFSVHILVIKSCLPDGTIGGTKVMIFRQFLGEKALDAVGTCFLPRQRNVAILDSELRVRIA